MSKIRRLGYDPEQVPRPGAPRSRARVFPDGIPEPIAASLETAREENRLLLIDFFASWCVACKVLESTVLLDPEVVKASERFRLLKLDTDEFVQPSRAYEVFGLPTLLVLGCDGEEVYRQEGMISAPELARELNGLAAQSKSCLDP
jgi:thiol:disulfide interchange protein